MDIDLDAMNVGDTVEIGVGSWGAELEAIWTRVDAYAMTHMPKQFETSRLWRTGANGMQEQYHVLTRVR